MTNNDFIEYKKKQKKDKKRFKQEIRKLKKIGRVRFDKNIIYCDVKKSTIRRAKSKKKDSLSQKGIINLFADSILNKDGQRVEFVFDKRKIKNPIELKIKNADVTIAQSEITADITFNDVDNNSTIKLYANAYYDSSAKRYKYYDIPRRKYRYLSNRTLRRVLIDGHAKNLEFFENKIINSIDGENEKENSNYFGIDITTNNFTMEDSTFFGGRFDINSDNIQVTNSTIKASNNEEISLKGTSKNNNQSSSAELIEINSSTVVTKGNISLDGKTKNLLNSNIECENLITSKGNINKKNTNVKAKTISYSKISPFYIFIDSTTNKIFHLKNSSFQLDKDYPNKKYLNNSKRKRINKIPLCRKLIKPEN